VRSKMGKYTNYTDKQLQEAYDNWEGVNPVISKQIQEEMALREPVKPVVEKEEKKPVEKEKKKPVEVKVDKPKSKSTFFKKKTKKK